MTEEQKAAYINGQVMCAQLEMEAMKVSNVQSINAGFSPNYVEEDFRAIVDRFCISHNDVISFFNS